MYVPVVGELKRFPLVGGRKRPPVMGELKPGLNVGLDREIADWFWWVAAGVCLLTPVIIAWLYL